MTCLLSYCFLPLPMAMRSLIKRPRVSSSSGTMVRPWVLASMSALISRRFDVKHVFGAMGWAPADEVEEVLNQHLASRKYFLGDEFSALDILLGGGVYFMLMAKMMKDTPVMKAYTERVVDRPAFRKMMEKDKKK